MDNNNVLSPFDFNSFKLEQIDEELSQFDDYHDVYDIIPKNEEFYSNMEIFETE